MKRLIKRMVRSLGYELFPAARHYSADGLFTLHSDRFRTDPAFRSAYDRGVVASNGIDPQFEWRVHVALWAAGMALKISGDFVECGVNAGFMSSAIMHRLDWNRTGRRYFLVDTFEGPPLEQFSSEEIRAGRAEIARAAMTAGSYVTDVERVRRNFAEWPSATVVQGRAPEVLPSIPADPVAFLHIDMNCAEPERLALEYFWPKLPRGGVVLLDDYAYYGHSIQGDAIDAVTWRLGCEVLALPTGQGLILR
jgi:hypothetical protein